MRFAADYSETLEIFLTPTDGISCHLYVSQSVVCEMATVQDRALCAIRDWQRRFLETGSVHDRKRSARPGVSNECVETIRASFVRSPTKSTRRASRELLLSRSTIHKVLHNTQFFKTPSGLCGHCICMQLL
jgi:hypothetical protein